MKSVLLVVCGVLLLPMAGDITTPEEMTKGLSRTIEGFTLGMNKDEALAILSGGVKKNNLTIFGGFSPGHFCKSFCNTHLRGCPIVYSRWRAQPIQQAQAMRDNLRRYRAIREAWTP